MFITYVNHPRFDVEYKWIAYTIVEGTQNVRFDSDIDFALDTNWLTFVILWLKYHYFESETWNDNLCDLQLPIGWDNARSYTVVEIEGGVASVHGKGRMVYVPWVGMLVLVALGIFLR